MLFRSGAESVSQFLLFAVDYGVGVEGEARSLLCHGADPAGMAMAYAHNGVSAIEIKIWFIISLYEDAAAGGAHRFHVEEGIYVKHFHNLECRGFELQSGFLGQTEHNVHILHGLPGSAFEQIVNGRNHQQAPVGDGEVNQGFVGVDNLFEVDILFRKAGKGSIFVELRIEVVQGPLSEWRLHSEHGIDAAGKTASHGDEVNAGCGVEVSSFAASFVLGLLKSSPSVVFI